MRLPILLALCGLFMSSVTLAQDDLYLSPSTNKTVENSLIITPDGNVGIGKESPENALEVNGRIHAKSVKVDLEGWADFVFEPDYNLPSLKQIEARSELYRPLSVYNLPSLKQIEAYIAQNGHLEGIPSEADALSNGIDLGQMNTLLLQKVEELTLHLIDKDKKINELEARLARLEALIENKD